MNFLFHGVVEFLNMGLATGLILGAMCLLRPVTARLLTPQQRVVLWSLGWLGGYLSSWYNITSWLYFLPVTFRTLITSRTSLNTAVPAYLPANYSGPGTYNLALPGGKFVPVELTDAALWALALLWIAGAAAVWWLFTRRDKALMRLCRQGELLPKDDPLLQNIPGLDPESVPVKLCPGLPCSFVRRQNCEDERGERHNNHIYLQAELPRDRLRLILRHEAQHMRLFHCFFKCYANCGLVFHWWNPVVWLAYRLFCRDLELSCDAAVLKELSPPERREYARALVELGSGRQLWEAPLSFGECDAELRVRAAVAWRPQNIPKAIAAWTLTALLFLFFTGGPRYVYPPQDLLLAYQRSGEDFLQQVTQIVEEDLHDLPEGDAVTEVWCRRLVPRPILDRSTGFDDALLAHTRSGWYTMELFWGGKAEYFWCYDIEPLSRAPDLSIWTRLA